MNTSTLFVADSPAKTSALSVRVPDWLESGADCGSSSTDLSPNCAPRGLSRKTSQPFDLVDWMQFSGASLRSGMMRNGTAYPLQPLVPLTGGTGSGLLPTPVASQDYKPLRFLTPSERGGTHGKMLVGVLGEKNPAEIGRYLNPSVCEWMMGFPIGWTDTSSSETQLSPKFQS